MAFVYRYIDKADMQIKYVGIVWGETRTLAQRLIEHQTEPKFKNHEWIIEYIYEDITTRTDAEYYEAHFISLYQTDKHLNVSKAGWGVSKFIPERNDWIEYDGDELKKVSKETKKKIDILKKENAKLMRKIKSLEKENSSYCDLIEELIRENSSLNRNIEYMKEERKRFEAKIHNLELSLINANTRNKCSKHFAKSYSILTQEDAKQTYKRKPTNMTPVTAILYRNNEEIERRDFGSVKNMAQTLGIDAYVISLAKAHYAHEHNQRIVYDYVYDRFELCFPSELHKHEYSISVMETRNEK